MEGKYILSYFPIKALAEPIRLLLSYGNIEFEDKRIPKEEWPEYKEKMPLRQMPVLQIGDKTFYQATAIARYLGKQVKLAGDNDVEAMEIDIAVDTMHDLRLKVSPTFYETDEALKEQKFADVAETMKFLLTKLDDMVVANNGYFATGKLTWADLWFVGIYDYLNTICRQDIGATYANIKSVVDKVRELPQIKAWYETAPKSDF